MMEENPMDWHNLLSETLWTYRTQRETLLGEPILTDLRAVLLMKVLVPSLRVAIQNNLVSKDYSQAVTLELEELDNAWMDALNKMVL